MIRKRNRFSRQMIVLGSIFGSTGELARGLWHAGGSKRLMIPLMVFLCTLGFVLVLAASVEALAPFIYTVF